MTWSPPPDYGRSARDWRMGDPEMTKEEREAMESINKYFNYREKVAFLVGWRLRAKKEPDTYTCRCGLKVHPGGECHADRPRYF